jgi:hypothetical protein
MSTDLRINILAHAPSRSMGKIKMKKVKNPLDKGKL